jgi:hypothetical protein
MMLAEVRTLARRVLLAIGLSGDSAYAIGRTPVSGECDRCTSHRPCRPLVAAGSGRVGRGDRFGFHVEPCRCRALRWHLTRADTPFAAIEGQGARLPPQGRYLARTHSVAQGGSSPAQVFADIDALEAGS